MVDGLAGWLGEYYWMRFAGWWKPRRCHRIAMSDCAIRGLTGDGRVRCVGRWRIRASGRMFGAKLRLCTASQRCKGNSRGACHKELHFPRWMISHLPSPECLQQRMSLRQTAAGSRLYGPMTLPQNTTAIARMSICPTYLPIHLRSSWHEVMKSWSQCEARESRYPLGRDT